MNAYFFFSRMLDDFNNELENTESKINATMKKVTKVLHITTGKLVISINN